MTIKAIILNVCDSFLKPKFLLKCVLAHPYVQGSVAVYTHHLGDSKTGFWF